MPTVYQHLIYQFNVEHDLTADSQFKCLIEEVGELSEALNRDADTDAVAEEIGDILFVARSIADLHNIDATKAVNGVARENHHKSGDTDGDKVLKVSEDTSEEVSEEAKTTDTVEIGLDHPTVIHTTPTPYNDG